MAKPASGSSGLRSNRRNFLAAGGLGALGTALAGPALVEKLSASTAGQSTEPSAYGSSPSPASATEHGGHAGGLQVVGEIAPDQYFNPDTFLTSWNFSHLSPAERSTYYRESTDDDGRTLREYVFVAMDRDIEIAPGIYFPAWTYNHQVPGPTIRATEGDRIRIWFINQGKHPHTIHFHGWHRYEMDGALGDQFVQPAQRPRAEFESFGLADKATQEGWLKQHRENPPSLREQGLEIYEFDADPVGLHLYHCHSLPLKRHIHKGLYGAFLVDPKGGRPTVDPDTGQELKDAKVRELVMVMNGFDTNFDADNEVYAVNTVAFHYMNYPIPVEAGDLVRVYLVNLLEFDLVNSFHLHAGFFRVYRTGTYTHSNEYTDTVMMCQAERAILEFRFRWPGTYMFHAHQSEFAELGWMGAFQASPAGNGVAVGQPMPRLELADASGRPITLDRITAGAPVVLVYYRGGCAHCSAQLAAIEQRSEQFGRLGAAVVAVCPDRVESQPKGETKLRLMADPDRKSAQALGLAATPSDLPLHGTFLVDRRGRLQWQHVGQAPYMDVPQLLARLEGMSAQR